MKTKVAIVVFACLIGRPTGLLVQGQVDRQLSYQPGVAIATLIRPTDRRVQVDMDPSPLKGFYPGDIAPADLIRAHALEAQAILVVKIDTKVPRLTPQADWIETTYQASIVEQLRPKARIAAPYVRIDLDGGSLEIRGVMVTANAEWEPRIEVGAQYLLFIDHMRDPVDGVWAYRIGEKQLLESTWNAFYDHGARDNVHGISLAEARKVLSATPEHRLLR